MIEEVRVNQELDSTEEAPDVDDGSASKTGEGGWLRSIPSNWDITRIKRIFRIVNGATPKTSEDAYWGGGILWVTPEGIGDSGDKYITETERTLTEEGLDSCGASVVPAGSIVLSIRAPIGHLAMAHRPVSTNQGCRSLIPGYGVEDPRFYYYALKAAKPVLQSFGTGATFRELSNTELGLVPVPVPPRQSQEEIADYLDEATANIDRLIAKKARLIELLEEKRTALITRAVTKGLDSDVPMKKSGVEWLGEIPRHWDTPLLDKLISRSRPITYGIVQPGDYDPNGILMVRGQNYSNGWDSPEDIFRVSPEVEAPYRRARLREGDVVMTIVGAGTGNVAIVPESIEGANITQTTARLAFDPDRCSNRFFAYVLESAIGQVNVDLAIKGAAQLGLNLNHIAKFRIVAPPLAEQKEIADVLDKRIGKIERLVKKTRKAQTLLREYRAALITEAVTGRIDVRDHAA